MMRLLRPRTDVASADDAVLSERSAACDVSQGAVADRDDGNIFTAGKSRKLMPASEQLLQETTAESGQSDASDLGCPSAEMEGASSNKASILSPGALMRSAPDSPVNSSASQQPSPKTRSPDQERKELEREDSLTSEEMMELWNLDDHVEPSAGGWFASSMDTAPRTNNAASRRASGDAAAMFTIYVLKGDNLGLVIKKNSIRIQGFKPSGSIVEYQRTCEPGMELRPGDRIVAINGLPLGPERLVKFLKNSKSTSMLAITVRRGCYPTTVSV
eukprot:TRINITY_DN57353_c0_g1_i1.p1 TRINITY_DN57353_c0_g1~~TRINITY_DN57353_c0_g1_i1.p1  ORF type:complete len:313 (-),score=43.50 TRINITY_DN57353_c0_g1_i1:272-1090(-)